MAPEEDDIADVVRAERSRGTSKPKQVASLEEQRRLWKIVRELLRPETTKRTSNWL